MALLKKRDELQELARDLSKEIAAAREGAHTVHFGGVKWRVQVKNKVEAYGVNAVVHLQGSLEREGLELRFHRKDYFALERRFSKNCRITVGHLLYDYWFEVEGNQPARIIKLLQTTRLRAMFMRLPRVAIYLQADGHLDVEGVIRPDDPDEILSLLHIAQELARVL